MKVLVAKKMRGNDMCFHRTMKLQ